MVDEAGRCIGVLSSTDFLHWVETGKANHPQDPRAAYSRAWQIVDPEALPDNEVRAHMTPDPITVAASTLIGDLARMMLDAHIHRVIVVGAQGEPIGIISSTDLLAALAHADEVRRLHGSDMESEKEHPEFCTR